MSGKFHIRVMGATLALALNAAAAQAQNNRTFVSGLGSDTGGCTIGSPCRSFAYAITQTNAGGEIVVLSSAGYGAVTINKAISITNEAGVEAAVTVSSGDGITIAAGTTDTVNLTGITLTGSGGSSGIIFTSGGTLNIKNCVVRGFTTYGLNLLPSASSNFNVTDTIASNNGDGINVRPSGTGATTTALFERVQAIGNAAAGFRLDGHVGTGTLQATAKDSDVSGNNLVGILVQSTSGHAVTTFTVIDSAVVNNNGYGLDTAGPNVTMFIAGSTVSGNGTGFFSDPAAVIKTFGNNNITDTNNFGALTKVGQQ